MNVVPCERRVPVSVVIPAFRARATLARAVDSVARQSALPCELIVVDDGSADGTAEMAQRLAHQYGQDWMKVLVLPQNRGAASARNVGWEAAEGEFIAFLDADDYWLPDKVEYQYAYMSTHADVVLSGHDHATISSPSVPKVMRAMRTETIVPWKLLLSNPFVTPSVMVRKSVASRFMAGKRYMEDHLLWMEIALSGGFIVKLNAPFAVIGKPAFGAGGLSAQMWQMEKGDLQNYWHLWRIGHIGLLATLFLSMFSLAKYLRRLIIVGLRR